MDALNLALSLCHTPLKAAGAQAIDFAPGGRHFSLAVGSVKPWQTHHLRQALRGHPPSVASRWYLHFAAGPLLPFSGVALARRRLSLQLAHAVGRLLQAWPSQPRHALRS